jgi:hypothetical protein
MAVDWKRILLNLVILLAVGIVISCIAAPIYVRSYSLTYIGILAIGAGIAALVSVAVFEVTARKWQPDSVRIAVVSGAAGPVSAFVVGALFLGGTMGLVGLSLALILGAVSAAMFVLAFSVRRSVRTAARKRRPAR